MPNLIMITVFVMIMFGCILVLFLFYFLEMNLQIDVCRHLIHRVTVRCSHDSGERGAR